MKRIILIFCFLLLFICGCTNPTNKIEKQEITINLPKDDKVNGYRTDDYISPDSIPQEEVSVSTENNTISYCGNKNSKVFHNSNCTSVKNMKESNKVYFSSKQKFTENGYSPCQKCNP